MSKKIRATVAKYDLGHQYAKKMGLPDPSGDLIYGSDRALSPEEAAKKAAKDLAGKSVMAPEATPVAVSDDTLAAREAQRKRQLASAGMGGTQLTGSRGLGGANTAMKSLLGS